MKRFTLKLVAILAIGVSCSAVLGQTNWPEKTIRFIVHYTPGGWTDAITRHIADKITADSKWAFMIDNKPGGGGNIGLDLVPVALVAEVPTVMVVSQTSTWKTLADSVKRLNAAVDKALATPALLKQLADEGSSPSGGSPEKVSAYLKSEQVEWAAVVREANVKFD